jgi:hypothetical protein
MDTGGHWSSSRPGLTMTATRSVIASLVAAAVLEPFQFRRQSERLRLAIPWRTADHCDRANAPSPRPLPGARLMARLSDDSALDGASATCGPGCGSQLEHPLLGVGHRLAQEILAERGFPGDYVTHTHSTPVQVAMDRGAGLPALGWPDLDGQSPPGSGSAA